MIEIYVFLGLMAIGYVLGTFNEKRHYNAIRAREKALQSRALIFNTRKIPPECRDCDMRLLAGSMVVSVDSFKQFSSKLQSFFGGNVSAYESLIDRARREAILRLRERADELGAPMIFGLRIETTAINDGDPQKTAGVELVAYGTAFVPRKTV